MLFPVNSLSPLFLENSPFFFMFLFKAILGLTALILKFMSSCTLDILTNPFHLISEELK